MFCGKKPKFCNKDVNSPHLVVAEREDVKNHKGFSTLVL